MLQELVIQNFAIISSLRLHFEEGMTVLTGETGAGKSIIIDAVGLLAGGRGSNDYIRQGENKCTLEGLFFVEPQNELTAYLDELAIEIEENMLVIQREIYQNGKNVCRINGHLVNTTVLRRVGHYLVDVHGQNEHQELMQASAHLGLLDKFGQQELQLLKAQYQKTYEAYTELKQRLAQKQTNEKEFVQRMDMLQFQVNEIEAAQLEEGEEERLLAERQKLANFQKIYEALHGSYTLLQEGEANGLQLVGMAMNQLAEIEDLSEDYQAISDNVQNSYFILQEAVSDMTRQLDLLEMDDGRLEEIELRLDLIRQLKRKYGESIANILTYYEQIQKELYDSQHFEEQSAQLEEKLAQLTEQLQVEAEQLSEMRKRIAKSLEAAVKQQLAELYMDQAHFEVHFKKRPLEQFSENGADQVEFYLTTNPGEPVKPLVKVASGGELSRIMLALKTIFSQTQGITSIIFDEVDTGVSGRVAQAIANKIHQVATYSQVLCITHLPQVAAMADKQYFIQKEILDERTLTTVKILLPEERVQEVARMLAGETITPLALEHAKELLDDAQQQK